MLLRQHPRYQVRLHNIRFIGICFTNIIPMPNNQGGTSPSNLFSLSSQKPHCYYKNVEVDFTPALVLGSQNSIIPTFFNDHQFFTPGFILPRDRRYYHRTYEYERYKFDALVLKASSSTGDSLENKKPETLSIGCPTNTFCQVCKKDYADYYEHINQMEHLSRIKKSTANLYIGEMTDKVNKRSKKRISKQKNRKGDQRGKQKTGKKAKSTLQQPKKKKVQKTAKTKSKNFTINTLA